MESQSTDRLRELLEAWYEAIESGRQPTIDELCKDDPSLRPVVERLIGHEESAVQHLEGLRPRIDDGALPVDRLGDFTLISAIGSGGMGRVFLARQESLGRLVALKVLHEGATADPRGSLRFRREAEIAASLDHPNIVPVYAVGEDRGHAYIAMKRLLGPSLDRLQTPLAPEETARIGAAVARALHAAHESGIIHRDVKPGNIMLDGGRPFVLDFGLARAVRDATVTRQGTVPGTLPYMPPEQLRSGTTILDSRSDVYALGTTLYEVVAGRPAFEGEDPEVLIRRILLREPSPLALAPRHRDLETIIKRAMDKDRERRFESAAAMADELDRFARGDPIRSRRTGVVTRTLRIISRHQRLALAFGMLAIAIVVVVGVLIAQGMRAASTRKKGLEEVREAVLAGRVSAARTLLRPLGRSDPGDEQVVLWSRRVNATSALQNLLDQLQDRSDAQDPATVDACAREVEANGGVDFDERLARIHLLARAVVGLHHGDRGLVISILDDFASRFGASRASAALRQALEASRGWMLPEAGVLGAEEHIFVLEALRIAGSTRDEQEVELRRALALSESDYRVRVANGIFLAESDARDDNLLALGFFAGALRDDELSPMALRNLARQEMIAGRLADARRHLEEHRRRTASLGATTAAFEVAWCDLLWFEHRSREWRQAVLSGIARYPEHHDLLMKRAQLFMIDRDPTGVSAALREAEHRARTPRQAARARAAVLTADHAALADAASTVPLEKEVAAERADLRAILERAGEQATRLTDPSGRSDALLVAARVERRLGQLREARRSLEESTRADPSNPAPRFWFARLVIERWLRARESGDDDPAEVQVDGPLTEAVDRARAELRELRASSRRGLWPPSRGMVEDALQMEADFALGRGDKKAAEAAAEELLLFLEDGLAEHVDTARIATVRALLDGIRTR